MGPLNDAIVTAAEAKKEVDDFGKALSVIVRAGAVVQKMQAQSHVAESLRANAQTMQSIMKRAPTVKSLDDTAANLEETRAGFAEVIDATKSMQETIENGDEEEEEVQVPDTTGKSGYEASLREKILDSYRLQIAGAPPPPAGTGEAPVVATQGRKVAEAPDVGMGGAEAEDGDDDNGDSTTMERAEYRPRPPRLLVAEEKADRRSRDTKPVPVPPSPSPPRRSVAAVTDVQEDDLENPDVEVYGSSPPREPVLVTNPLPSPPPPPPPPLQPPPLKQVSVRRL